MLEGKRLNSEGSISLPHRHRVIATDDRTPVETFQEVIGFIGAPPLAGHAFVAD